MNADKRRYEQALNRNGLRFAVNRSAPTCSHICVYLSHLRFLILQQLVLRERFRVSERLFSGQRVNVNHHH